MSEDFAACFDAELQGSPKTLTDNLFHYTNADAALFGILSTGSLRLSPFDSTNDLWESRPTHPTLTAHADDVDLDVGMELWDEIDLHIRRNANVACLTMDWDLPERVMDRDPLCGWGHLSLWAHSGVCLRFNKPALLAAFESGESPRVRSFHGPVQYRRVFRSGQGHTASTLDRSWSSAQPRKRATRRTPGSSLARHRSCAKSLSSRDE
jgi:hypothetical protein